MYTKKSDELQLNKVYTSIHLIKINLTFVEMDIRGRCKTLMIPTWTKQRVVSKETKKIQLKERSLLITGRSRTWTQDTDSGNYNWETPDPDLDPHQSQVILSRRRRREEQSCINCKRWNLVVFNSI